MPTVHIIKTFTCLIQDKFCEFAGLKGWWSLLKIEMAFETGIPVGTKYSPLVADLFLFSYVGDSMLSLSEDTQMEVIEVPFYF